ncbi:MAG: peptide deformylase, partial [Bacteroidota bacterium]
AQRALHSMRNIILLILPAFLLSWHLGMAQKPSKFSKSEKEFVGTGTADDPMRVYLITNPEDSVLLRTPSKPVKVNAKDKELKLFVDRMYRTVRDSASMGVGIAAPQVGVLRQIIWVQRFDKKNFPFEVYLNPVIKQYTKKQQCGPEGCLSVPERTDSVFRAYAILLEYDKMDGSHEIEMIEGFTAVIFQHEIDHLNGIIYLDHLVAERREALQKP